MTDLFEQTIQVLVSLAMLPDAETFDDITLHREVDALIDAYLVWTRTRRPAGFRPKDYNERDEFARPFGDTRCDPALVFLALHSASVSFPNRLRLEATR